MTSEAVEPVRCLRCGRQFRAASSVRLRYGRGWRAIIRAAALAEAVRDFTAEQIEKARDLIGDGGLVPAGNGLFEAVSSRGDVVYSVTRDGDDCPRGQRGKLCYHVAAVRMVEATRRPA